MGFSKWFKKNRKNWNVEPKRPSIFVERPCIGCLLPFRRWGVTSIPLVEQFCSKRCKNSFFHGYELGMKVVGDWSQRNGRR